MPTKEEKHHSSGGGSSSSSSSSSSNGSNSSNGSSGNGTEKHKYCLLCNRNEFTLKSFDPTNEKDLRAIYNIDRSQIKFKENRKVCLQCLHSIKLLKRCSSKDEPTKKYGDCCKDLFENVTYVHELRNKYQRYVNRWIDSRNKDKDKESPKKTSDHTTTSSSSSNQSTPSTCSPVSSVPSTSPDVINTTPKSCIKQTSSQQKQSPQQQSSQSQQPTKLNDKSPNKMKANGKSLKPIDMNHCKGIKRLQYETVSVVKTSEKEKGREKQKEKEKEKEKDTVKNAAGGAGSSKKKTPPNHPPKKDVAVAQDSEKQKSPAKTTDDVPAKDKLIEEASKSIDGTTKCNKRRSQDRKVEQEPSGGVAESGTKAKLSNSSNSIVTKASPVAENNTETIIGAKAMKPSKLPTNTKKSRVQRSSSPKQQMAATQTPTRQQKNCTFEQALSQAETTRSKTRTQTQKRSVLTQTPSELGPSSESESVSVSQCEVPTTESSSSSLSEKETPENELPAAKLTENKVPETNTPHDPPKARKISTEKFEFTIINGKRIEVPARAKLDPKMFQCLVKLSREPYQKRKIHGSMEMLSPPPVKKKRKCNKYDKIEADVQFEAATNDASQTPKSILHRINRPRTPISSRKKRVSFIGVPSPPASPPSNEKTETPKVGNTTTDDTTAATVSEAKIVDTTTVVDAPKVVDEPKITETPTNVESNQESMRPKKKSRASKRSSNENSGSHNTRATREKEPAMPPPTSTEVVASKIVLPIVEEAMEVDSSEKSAPEAQTNGNSSHDERDAILPTVTVAVAEVKVANVVNDSVARVSEEISIIDDTSDGTQSTPEPIKKKRKPYTRTKSTNVGKEKSASKRQRKQVLKKAAYADDFEAQDDIELVNPEEIKRNILIESIVESGSDEMKMVDETDEDEVKLLVEQDPLAIGNEDDCRASSPVPTPISTPISIPISIPISVPISTPTVTATPLLASTSISTPIHMPAQIPKPNNLDATPDTPKSMTSAPVVRSHETSLKIKISNGKVVQSDISPPQTSPSNDLNSEERSPKSGVRSRVKRIRKKKLTPEYVDHDVSASESDESTSRQPSSVERKKRRSTPSSKRTKDKDVAVQLTPSTNVEEVARKTVDQTPPTPTPVSVQAPPPSQLSQPSQPSQLIQPTQPSQQPLSITLPLQAAPQPPQPVDDRVFRAYVLVDKMYQQINTTNLGVLSPQSQSISSHQSAYPHPGTQLVFRTEPISPSISQATESLLQMNSMNNMNSMNSMNSINENSGCVATVIHNMMENNVENDDENETEPHSMGVIQSYTNDGMNNDGMYEVQETTICENVESPTVPIVQTDNTGAIIGFESPATVDSTTSGYSSATATSSVYLVDTQSLNHSIEMNNGFNAADFNMQQLQYETFPFVEIQTSDIIDILGKPSDCNESLNMENINLDTTASTADTRTTYYLTDEHSINAINTINTINTVATVTQTLPTLTTGNILGVFRTKASLKQIDPPPTMHLFTDASGHAHHPHAHALAHPHTHPLTHTIHGHGSGIPNELSAKMLRSDNPLLNAVISSNDESSIEMQDANESFSMAVDSMVTSSDTVQAIQRRPGLNVVFSTPSKRNNVYLSNENVSIDDFISESHQSLLNADNFPTTTTTEEPHLDFYTLGI